MRYILYIIGVALVTMFLIYLGYMKERNLTATLVTRLYGKCRQKVLKKLQVTSELSAIDIRNLILDVTASVLWSRKKLGVTNPVQFTNYLIDSMIKDGKIIEIKDGKKRAYKIGT